MDDDLMAKIRKIQSKQLIKSNKPISFSKVVRDLLRKGLK